MKKIKIVTDSSAIFEPGVVEQLGIERVPLSVMVDSVSYLDDAISGNEFIELMKNADSLPKTSQPAIGLFVEKYEELKDYDVISIHLTHHLSGTVDAARQASHMVDTDVEVFDSGYIDQGLAFQAIRAAEMANNGATKEEILEMLVKMKKNTRLFVGISTLENLVKGGRLSKTKGMISQVLNIKAVLELTPDEGLKEVAKGRGGKTFTKWFDGLVESLSNTKNIESIAISHVDALSTVTPFCEKLRTLYPQFEIPPLVTGSVIATHAGLGAFALEYVFDTK